MDSKRLEEINLFIDASIADIKKERDKKRIYTSDVKRIFSNRNQILENICKKYEADMKELDDKILIFNDIKTIVNKG